MFKLRAFSSNCLKTNLPLSFSLFTFLAPTRCLASDHENDARKLNFFIIKIELSTTSKSLPVSGRLFGFAAFRRKDRQNHSVSLLL